MQNLLKLKSRAYFIDAFRGTIVVKIERNALGQTTLWAKLSDEKRYASIMFPENRIQLLGDDSSYGAYESPDSKRIVDGGSYAIAWCGKQVGGIFRRAGENWIVEPPADSIPPWWNEEDWIATVVGDKPHIRDLLLPP